MYDSICFILRNVDVNFKMSFMEELSCYINVINYRSNNHKIEGCLRNMRVVLTEDKVIITGSIVKWYKGNNVESLSLEEIEDAIKSLGNELHIPIEKARVWRLDFGANFRMKYSPELYLTKLGYLDNFHRSHLYPTSLYYNKRTKNADRQLIFYDKTSELKSKNRTITKDISSNLLRYEFKLLKNAPRQLKRKVRVTDLYDPLFYKGMLDLWYKTYEEIEKHRDNPPRLNFTRGKKFFYISAIQYCCNVENISDFIDELSMKREINAKQKYELKKIVKNALKEENYSAEDDSKIDELTVYVLEEYLKQLKMLKKFENRKVV